MIRWKIFSFVVLIGLCLAAVGQATVSFTCKSAGRVWNVTPGMWPIEVTMMVAKSGTDCDIVVDDLQGSIVALGIGVESRFETVRFGPLPGVPIRITAIKAGGSNSKAYLRANDSARFLASVQGPGARSPRSARELAREDPAYARVLETWERYRLLKSPLAAATD